MPLAECAILNIEINHIQIKSSRQALNLGLFWQGTYTASIMLQSIQISDMTTFYERYFSSE